MIAEYINRKKESHFLISKMTKNGKERYYIVRNKSKFDKSELLNEIPYGFEFYEYPEDGRVVLRKILKSTITQDEIEIVDETMKNHLTAKDYILDKMETSIIVYLGYLDKEDYVDSGVFFHTEEYFRQIQSYNYKLRFEKVNNNTYKAQRFCRLSDYDCWITIETSDDLIYLSERYCFHIDKESLVQFWIEGEEDW